MEIFEVLFAIAIWVLVSYLGWRKKAARGDTPAPPPPWSEFGGDAEGPVEQQPASAAPQTLRELIRHMRGEPFDENAPPGEPRGTSELPRPASIEEDPWEPEIRPRLAPRSRRPATRSLLAAELMRDLTSGPRSLARAVLLREVLGPPVALRAPGSDLPGTRR